MDLQLRANKFTYIYSRLSNTPFVMIAVIFPFLGPLSLSLPLLSFP